jgi:hypothetical protein
MTSLLFWNNLKETGAWIITLALILLSQRYIIEFIKFVLSKLYEVFIIQNPLTG